MRAVEVGLNNDSYIEITSGLEEGDIVVLPPLASSTTGTSTQQTQGIGLGGLGGLGGGANIQQRQFSNNRNIPQRNNNQRNNN